MTILLSDPRVHAIPLRESCEPLVALGASYGDARALVRAGLADRLAIAHDLLPCGVHLKVVEGHRPMAEQRAIIDRYTRQLRVSQPEASDDELYHLSSRFVAPVDVAPHVAGAAIDLTLVDSRGEELDLGTCIDATPEESDGRCWFAADTISADARAYRAVLARVLGAAGLVNYPTEWWHWSYGDRYWALVTGADAALYGPVERTEAAS
jgi:D-alanyl-D-alanine dipeptidase